MNQYIYFILGILLGLAIAVYYFISREEKIEKIIKHNQKIFSTKRPVFFVVSASIENYIVEMRKLKIRYYLNKPYYFDELMRILSYIYNDVYPRAILNIENQITENKYISLWNKIRSILKRI